MLKPYTQSILVSIFLGLAISLGLMFSSIATLAAITKGYNTDDVGLKPGMVVSLSQDGASENTKVERASSENAERIIGVATTVDESLVTISSGEKGAYVESDGEVDAYVVNLDGEIKQGDLLALSSIRGVLTKAFPPQPIIAIAIEDFSSAQADTYSIQDGTSQTDVLIQRLRVNLDRKAFANLVQVPEESALAKLGYSVIGRDVGEIRVAIALIIFLLVLVAEGTILYGAISSAISALGRNPLAKNIIKRELVRVIFVALTVLVLGVAAVYAVLWV